MQSHVLDFDNTKVTLNPALKDDALVIDTITEYLANSTFAVLVCFDNKYSSVVTNKNNCILTLVCSVLSVVSDPKDTYSIYVNGDDIYSRTLTDPVKTIMSLTRVTVRKDEENKERNRSILLKYLPKDHDWRTHLTLVCDCKLESGYGWASPEIKYISDSSLCLILLMCR